jgi:hypothetical protein
MSILIKYALTFALVRHLWNLLETVFPSIKWNWELTNGRVFHSQVTTKDSKAQKKAAGGGAGRCGHGVMEVH